ncbi:MULTISPECIES: PTS sugar transporter subunit IIA [Clostridium]|uniref:PTS glucose transporter subunit IIA n=1 Tax=Clostridium cadaveris TaxID=1529 RepID=A0A1I2P039_9CLOT|nr:PTS glucose transporter subunit IIA [Clostridium cadaveris]MDU4951779.1 PTS glucose transporter subunit IIA [Clostridium sp.]MDM8312366.1 PTS glucose transporter subunit IIA [Clostridium cadaveris]MDY4949354.1 PTS glucose transporter subunit IIA [Clostridium cadaveris]NME64791.1 PTS glucose transporter subunit IIA [Clostridium cadaveris]NWK12332.1 PTS glucose transporter subunit IIA [Clostridium cadaveris]
MFGFLKKKNSELVAPVSGKVIELSQVPDEVFSQKMAGDGVAIEPSDDLVVAPADGSITLIFKTNHAFAMTLENGLEILVHIGLDTVELNGEGFERLATEGETVKAGTPIVKINRKLFEEKGYKTVTPVLVTNPDILKEMNGLVGNNVTAGKDAVISYKK